MARAQHLDRVGGDHRRSSPSELCDRVIDLHVAGAAAQVAGEAGADLLARGALAAAPAPPSTCRACRCRTARRRTRGRRAAGDAAAGCLPLAPRSLRRWCTARPSTWQVGTRHAVDRLAVDEHGAGAALAFAAALLGAGERRAPRAGCRAGASSAATSTRCFLPLTWSLSFMRCAFMMRSGVAGIASSRLPVAARMALTIAAAGPSMGHSPTPLAPNGPCAYGFSTISTAIGGVSSVVGMM